MTVPFPRRAVFEGSVVAQGFLLRDMTMGAHGCIARVIEGWTPGAQLFALSPGEFVWVLPRAARVACDACPGQPLVSIDGVLWGMPLDETGRRAIDAPRGTVVYVDEGVMKTVSLDATMRVDPSEWLVLPEVVVAATRSLVSPPPLVAEVYEAKTIREVLRDVPPVASAQQQFVESMASAKRRSTGHALARPGFLRGMLQVLSDSLPSWWPESPSGWLPPRTSTSTRARQGTGATGLQLASAWQRMRERFATAWRTRLLLSPLGQLFTRAQAAYLRKMLAMFEEGDLTEALRHAIPLASNGLTPSAPALGIPGPRELTILAHRSGATSSFQFGNDVYAHLRERYLKAAARLREQGRWEEAAYVYAELLGDAHGAVELLQDAGRHQQAAELAEARELPPAAVVRAWMLAKDVERAVAVAVRHNAFADAIRLLEKRDLEASNALRLTWANRLATSGQYAAAVDALWPVEDARALALHWMRRVIDHGGVPAARMLVRVLTLVPDAVGDYRGAFEAMWNDASDVGVMARGTLAQALIASKPAGAQRVAARCLREVLNDEGNGHAPSDRRLCEALGALAGDAVLVADLPSRVGIAMPELRKRERTLDVTWSAQDVGALPVFDVVPLPNGGWLLSLGEAGVRFIDRRGRLRAHLEHPAYELVTTLDGSRVIAIARRDSLQRLARIDTLARRAEAWGQVQLDAWSDAFDGEHWFVRTGDTVQRVDATRDGFHANWSVRDPDLDGALLTGASGVVALTTREAWSYDGKAKLRRRAQLNLPRSSVRALGWDFGHAGVVSVISDPGEETDDDAADTDRCLHLWQEKLDIPIAGSEGAYAVKLTVDSGWAATSWCTDKGSALVLQSLVDGRVVFRLNAEGATRLRARLTGHTLAICDDRGRLLGLDTSTGHIIVDHRCI